MSAGRRRCLRVVPAALLALLHTAPARAIDNPDAPDFVAEFEARCQPLEAAIEQAADGSATAQAQAQYAGFLDQELNRAYQQLQSRLPAADRQALQAAQRRWLAFRDSESAFVAGHFSQSRYGTSAAITRAASRTRLVKQRVLALLVYLKSQPSPR
jgi:uncharacterized protein YecT (DUF1311 family)